MSGLLGTRADRPRPSPKRLTRLFGVGDAYVYVTHNPVGGVALDWIRRLCFSEQSEQEFFDRTIPAARDSAHSWPGPHASAATT